ncbi:MAG TPA: YqiA/YcfP family alpha/beta fold hydrolase [Bryobacteraceae bacterium]|nr:YqiA/YcfP family alpha/beta fold hydrolase [Bryobacteraceae bacterium]
MHIVYLHGFASSPQSSKAQFFKRKFEELGIMIEIPELDGGNFERLTVSGMLEVVNRVIEERAAGRTVVLIGSSLGGFVAGLYAARHPREVERLVLLAPALQFAQRWRARFPAEELAEWKRQGWKDFYHYGRKRDEPLGYSFIEDAAQFEDEPESPQPTLILHGSRDEIVPVEMSRDYARRHPQVELKEFASGHEMTDGMEDLWLETAAFLGLA